MPITITDAALERVLEVRDREHEPEGLALWVEIVGVAGAAYQYDMSFLRHDEIDETDVVVTSGGCEVLTSVPIDPIRAQPSRLPGTAQSDTEVRESGNPGGAAGRRGPAGE